MIFVVRTDTIAPVKTNWKQKIKHNQTLISLISMQALNAVLGLFISVFLTAKLFVTTGQDIVAISLFNIVMYTATFLFCLVVAFFARKIRSIWFLRSSALLICLSVFFAAFFTDTLGNYYLVYGLLYGIGNGLYWGSAHLIAGDVFNKGQMKKYISLYHIVTLLIRIVFPFTLGTMIEFVSFELTAIVVFSLGVLEIVASIFIKQEKKKAPNLRMREFFRHAKKSNALKPILLHSLICICSTVTVVVPIAITMLTMTIFESTFDLGMFTSIFVASSVVVLILFRLTKGKVRSAIYIISTILPFLASFFLLAPQNAVFFMIFNGFFSALMVIANFEREVLHMNLAKYLGIEQFYAENNSFIEVAYWTGRMLAFCILAIAAPVAGTLGFSIFIICITALLPIIAILNICLNKRYANQTVPAPEK